MFNPQATLHLLPILPGQVCVVVDDALAEPERWVELAAQQRAHFSMEAHNAYPGVELRLPDPISERLSEFFAQQVRAHLRARRVQRAHSRLSIVTLPPELLLPRQWICHRDRMGLGPEHRIAASVLYLFKNPALGGTNFFVPRHDEASTARLVHDSGTLNATEFGDRYGIQRGYLTESNGWFEKVQSIPARWNRMIFYDGTLFHCSDVPSPDQLSDDPARGRLTLNGFFTCTPSL